MEKEIRDRGATAANLVVGTVWVAAFLAWLINLQMATTYSSVKQDANESRARKKPAPAPKNAVRTTPQFCAHEFYDP